MLYPKRLRSARKVEDAANQNQQIIKDLESMIQFLEEQQFSSLTEKTKALCKITPINRKNYKKSGGDR